MERLISNLISSAREVEELLEFNCVENELEDDKDLFKLQRLLDDAVSLAEGLHHKKIERILGL